jgi:hypothetical protein
MLQRQLLLRGWLGGSPSRERRDLVARGRSARHEEPSRALVLQRIVGRAVQRRRANNLTSELDGALWSALSGITSFPTHDLFSTFR